MEYSSSFKLTLNLLLKYVHVLMWYHLTISNYHYSVILTSHQVLTLLYSIFIVSSTEHTLGHIFAITTSINNGTFNEDIYISSGFMLAEFICGQGMIVTITALSGNIHHNIMTKVDFPTILHFKECELVVAETSNKMLANKSWQVKIVWTILKMIQLCDVLKLEVHLWDLCTSSGEGYLLW